MAPSLVTTVKGDNSVTYSFQPLTETYTPVMTSNIVVQSGLTHDDLLELLVDNNKPQNWLDWESDQPGFIIGCEFYCLAKNADGITWDITACPSLWLSMRAQKEKGLKGQTEMGIMQSVGASVYTTTVSGGSIGSILSQQARIDLARGPEFMGKGYTKLIGDNGEMTAIGDNVISKWYKPGDYCVVQSYEYATPVDTKYIADMTALIKQNPPNNTGQWYLSYTAAPFDYGYGPYGGNNPNKKLHILYQWGDISTPYSYFPLYHEEGSSYQEYVSKAVDFTGTRADISLSMANFNINA